MTFEAFSSLDEMWEHMRENEEAANNHLAPEQGRVGYGDYWVRFHDIDARVIIFGYVMDPGEVRLAEMGVPLQSGETAAERDEEVEQIMETMADSHSRGYMYGKCYSIIEVDGEWGSTHRANLWPIPQALYEAAKFVDWSIDRLGDIAKSQLQSAYSAYRAHMLSLQ